MGRREKELAHKAALLELVVGNVNQGISFVNADLIVELSNANFGALLELPPDLCRPGTPLIEIFRYNALRGEYGAGDPEALAQKRIAIRLARIEAGLLGDWKTVNDGVSEIRLDYGPGYRLYYTIRDRIVIVLLCGSEKRDQDRAIKLAKSLAERM